MSTDKCVVSRSEYGDKARPDNRNPLTNIKLMGLILGPVVLVGVLMLPLSLAPAQQALLAVILMTVIYWIFQPIAIPVTSILALTLTIVLDVASARTVFGAFSSPTLFLLIGAFLITLAMVKYGLGKRIALTVLSLPGIGGSTTRIIIAFDGAVASMLVPIAVGLIQALSEHIRRASPDAVDGGPLRFGTALMLITAYGATVGALLTPFGDATNMVGRAFIEKEFDILIPVGSWMALAAPIVLVLFSLLDAGCRRLLWMGRERKTKTLLGFFRWFGNERTVKLRFICSDMWKPYLKVIAKNAGHAIHVLDRFHIMASLSKSIDKVRAEEARQLKRDGYEPVLSKTRWLLLKRPENLTAKQAPKLAELLRYNLKTVRSYLLK